MPLAFPPKGRRFRIGVGVFRRAEFRTPSEVGDFTMPLGVLQDLGLEGELDDGFADRPDQMIGHPPAVVPHSPAERQMIGLGHPVHALVCTTRQR